MTTQQRKRAFVHLKSFLEKHFSKQFSKEEQVLHQGLTELISSVHIYNPWFSPHFVEEALKNIAFMLDEQALQNFCDKIPEVQAKRVAVICAGNIPLVCFHDVMSVLLSGHILCLKCLMMINIFYPFF